MTERNIFAGFLIFHVVTMTIFYAVEMGSRLPEWFRWPVLAGLAIWASAWIWRGRKDERTGA